MYGSQTNRNVQSKNIKDSHALNCYSSLRSAIPWTPSSFLKMKPAPASLDPWQEPLAASTFAYGPIFLSRKRRKHFFQL